jgi:NAD(P)-dependent dehydrogenase (short-subunit alcohol dehydrogenase family)
MGEVLKGKVALVTGASSGMGMSSARLLAEDGATVVMMGRRADALMEAREALKKRVPGARFEIFAGDALKEEDVKAATKFAAGLEGHLDICVSAVGGCKIKPLMLQDVATFMGEYELNTLSAFLMIRYGVPHMPQGGAIVCVSTAVAVQPFPGLAAYAAANAGLERLVKAAAHELGPARIRVNAVRPGMTRSAATEGMYAVQELVKRFEDETILGRTGEPDDVARVIRFFAGPESGWVTGQSISADGGQEQGKVPDLLDDLYGADVMAKVRIGRPPETPVTPNASAVEGVV